MRRAEDQDSSTRILVVGTTSKSQRALIRSRSQLASSSAPVLKLSRAQSLRLKRSNIRYLTKVTICKFNTAASSQCHKGPSLILQKGRINNITKGSRMTVRQGSTSASQKMDITKIANQKNQESKRNLESPESKRSQENLESQGSSKKALVVGIVVITKGVNKSLPKRTIMNKLQPQLSVQGKRRAKPRKLLRVIQKTNEVGEVHVVAIATTTTDVLIIMRESSSRLLATRFLLRLTSTARFRK